MAVGYIGAGQEFDPGPNGNVQNSIWDALTDSTPRRELIFTDASYIWTSGIDLDSSQLNQNLRTLKLFGAGPHMMQLNRQTGNSVHLFGGGSGWTIELYGIHIHDNATTKANYPLVSLYDFASFTAKLCAFNGSGGWGLVLAMPLSTNNAGTVTLRDVRCDANANGLLLDKVGYIDFLGGQIQNNANTGIYIADDTLSRTSGVLRGLHFEINGPSCEWGVILDHVNNIALYDLYLYASSILMQTDTSGCVVDNIAYWECASGTSGCVLNENTSGNSTSRLRSMPDLHPGNCS